MFACRLGLYARLARLPAALALFGCMLFTFPLGAQTRVKRIRIKPHDYVPYPETPVPNPTYNGGTLLAHATYWMVYWGPYWTSGLGLQQRRHFTSFVENIAPSTGFTGQFAEYQEPGFPILNGQLGGEILIDTSPGASIDDATFTNQISAWITSGVLPTPDENTVFVMMFPQGTDVTSDGQSACQYFFGYHYLAPSPLGSFGRYRYIVLPYQNCGGDAAGDGAVAINGMTDTLSHELAEVETDPDCDGTLPYGWIDNGTGNELADICVGTAATLGYRNFWFQKIWSNAAATCIGPTAGSSSLHLTISLTATQSPGTVEQSGVANVLSGFPATFTVSTDSTTPVGLSVSGLPSGVTYKLSSPTVTAKSSATLEISTDASPGPSGMGTVTATLNSQKAQFQFLVVPWLAVSTVSVTNSGFPFSTALQLYAGTITVTNTGSQAIGPTILLDYHGLDPSIFPATVGVPGIAGTGIGYNEVGPNGDYFVQLPDGMLGPGQSVTQNVAFSNPYSVAINFTPQVFVVQAGNACDISQNGISAADVQLIVNEALGASLPVDDLNADGAVDIVDLQIVANAALGLGCSQRAEM